MAAEIRRVSDSIICVRRVSYLTCSYIVRTKTGLVLIDAGMDSDGADVDAGLAAMKATHREVRAILLTHWHNDHTAGAQITHQRSGAPVFYHRGDEEFYTGRGGARGFRKWVSDRIPEMGVLVLAKGLLGESTPRPVSADTYVNDGDAVLEDFEVIATPGHTDGHVSYFYRPERALFAGDALAVIDGRIRFMARPVTLDLASARESMRRVLALRPEIVCPGHREPLVANVPAAVEAMQRHLASGGKWPLFG
ncbi:MAG TPA: MBL fold metallo-hydrolase [Vicinamibacterales bacterium]|nr:MBL fold metallo-hydrolase [Vicinamibacterales bacterium]